MKRSQFGTVPKTIHDEEEEDPLQKQFKSLEKQWDSIKHSNSRSNRRNSTGESSATVSVDHHLLQLLDNSPKELMSSLQQQNSPSEGYLSNSRHHDRAAIEIIKEREAAFDTSTFKGKRLFEESEMGSDESALDLVQDSEGRSEFSYGGSDNDENFINGANHNRFRDCRCSCMASPAPDAAEKSGSHSGVGGVGRWMLNMSWVGVVIMLFALGIVAFKCSGEDEQILVPT